MTDQFEALNFERDMPLTEDDVRALDESRHRRIDPSKMEWAWFSLGEQFPDMDRNRPTSEGWVEFEL